MFNWLWKWMGYHVCEEFTQWSNPREVTWTRPPHNGMEMIAARENLDRGEQYAIYFTERYQERRCTICGEIHRRAV